MSVESGNDAIHPPAKKDDETERLCGDEKYDDEPMSHLTNQREINYLRDASQLPAHFPTSCRAVGRVVTSLPMRRAHVNSTSSHSSASTDFYKAAHGSDYLCVRASRGEFDG